MRLYVRNLSLGASFSVLNRIVVLLRRSSKCRCCNFSFSKVRLGLFKENDHFIGPPWRILFYGSDEFSVINLTALQQEYLKVQKCQEGLVEKLEVVSGDNKKNPVRKFCEENGLRVHDWPYEVPDGHYDVGAVASFGALIPEQNIASFPLGILNAHPSLLPRWRGAAPIIHTILKGDEFTGVSIMEIVPKKFDVGKILLQKSCRVPVDVTTTTLTRLLGKMSAQMLVECLSDLPNFLKNGTVQSKDGAVTARKIKLAATYVDWANCDVRDVDRMFRAFKDIYYLRTTWHGQHVKLLQMVPLDLTRNLDLDSLAEVWARVKNTPTAVIEKLGFVFYHRKRRIICVRCKDGWAGFKRFTVTTKTEMDACQFYNGYVAQVEPNKTYFEHPTNLTKN